MVSVGADVVGANGVGSEGVGFVRAEQPSWSCESRCSDGAILAVFLNFFC